MIKLNLLPPIPPIPEAMPHWATELDFCYRDQHPVDYMRRIKRMTEIFDLRDYYVRQGMYACVATKWTRPLAKWIGSRRCLEVMAGRGFLSYALTQEGVNVIATDNLSWAWKWADLPPVTQLIQMDAIEAVHTFGKDIDLLIASWPYMDDTMYLTAKALHEVNPNALIIYIGEDQGGCTANDYFFERIMFVEDDAFDKVSEQYDAWQMLHDRLCLFEWR